MIRFGETPVPFTVGWTDEERFFLGECPEFKRLAIRQHHAPGGGKPLFGKPHSDRQRRAIAHDLCDLCGRSLKHRTKVSLSHARPQPHGADGWAILQVEPMLHRECAVQSIRFCPSLRRDVKRGSLFVRQVTRHRAQCAILSAEYVASVTGQHVKALGHAKVELLAWVDRDLEWLLAGTP